MKNPTFRGGGSWNTNIEGGLPKKGGLGQFANLRRGLTRKRWVVFLRGVDTPMHTMHLARRNILFYFIFFEGGMNINTILSKSTDYQTIKNPLQLLQSRQSKLISSITMCQKNLSSMIICQKKLWSLGFDKNSNRSQREKF